MSCRRLLPDNAVVTTDAGNMGGWLARGFRFRRPGTFIGPASGAMGFGLPAAIAGIAARTRPHRGSVCGDGGFAMSAMELETAVREGAHPIVLVFDNERYGTIAMSQSQEGRSSAGSDLGPVDFAAIARAQVPRASVSRTTLTSRRRCVRPSCRASRRSSTCGWNRAWSQWMTGR